MTESTQDYLARAAISRAAADAEPLENARRKHLASAAAWEALAKPIRLRAATAAAAPHPDAN